MGGGGRGGSHWLLGWTVADSYNCLPIRVRGGLTASLLKVVGSKSLTASSALRINLHSNNPQILEHSLVTRVHRQVDLRIIPITLAEGGGS